MDGMNYTPAPHDTALDYILASTGTTPIAVLEAALRAARAAARTQAKVVGITDYESFCAARAEAIRRAGPGWTLSRDTRVGARIPAAWARFRGRLSGQWHKTARDMPLPAPQFWPAGEMPAGIEWQATGPAPVGGTVYSAEDILALNGGHKGGNWRHPAAMDAQP